MPKLSLNTTLNYSPNFDLKKRKPNQIKFIIFHYTGMKSEKQAIDKLTNYKSKVSCHYFIKKNGEIISLLVAATINFENVSMGPHVDLLNFFLQTVESTVDIY